MPKVKYVGPGVLGTYNPRGLWRSGDIKDVSAADAKELLKLPDFIKLEPPKKKARPKRKRRPRRKKAAE